MSYRFKLNNSAPIYFKAPLWVCRSDYEYTTGFKCKTLIQINSDGTCYYVLNNKQNRLADTEYYESVVNFFRGKCDNTRELPKEAFEFDELDVLLALIARAKYNMLGMEFLEMNPERVIISGIYCYTDEELKGKCEPLSKYVTLKDTEDLNIVNMEGKQHMTSKTKASRAKTSKNRVSKMPNTELMDELLSLYSKDIGYEGYYDSDVDMFNEAGEEHARQLREEVLNRMVDSNAETFSVFGVRNKATGKLVSDITNPRHKYWERKGNAESALNGYTAGFRYRKGTYNKDDLEVVTIKCTVQEKDNE